MPYTITATNTSATVTTTTDVVDLKPAGFTYKAGTGRVGTTLTDPTITGSRFAFNGVVVPPNSTVTIRLGAFVSTSAQPGPNTNRVRVLNPVTGTPIAPEATATVLVEADPVFDCGTVIGRIFDAANQDGYMNGPTQDRRLTTQDDVADDKAGRAPDVKGNGEMGIPGVRLVTVRGTIITTDTHGRFNVPCADLPRDIGSNFR